MSVEIELVKRHLINFINYPSFCRHQALKSIATNFSCKFEQKSSEWVVHIIKILKPRGWYWKELYRTTCTRIKRIADD